MRIGGSSERGHRHGGIFFKANDAVRLREWYKRHLGNEIEDWGGTAFRGKDADGQPVCGTKVWSILEADTVYLAPGKAPFMINYRVDDLLEVLGAILEASYMLRQPPFGSKDNRSGSLHICSHVSTCSEPENRRYHAAYKWFYHRTYRYKPTFID